MTMNRQSNTDSSTGSPIGSYHWFHTLAAKHLALGELLTEEGCTDQVLLRQWGRELLDTSQELVDGYNKINKP